MAQFTILLQYPTTISRSPAVLEAKFGDGYSQRAGDGINTNLESWEVEATGIPSYDAYQIDTFFSARGGHEAFQWTSPAYTAVEKNYICRKWKVTYGSEDNCTFSGTFEEVMG